MSSGYSRLIGSDKEGTLAALKSHRRDLIDPTIAEHRGRIVKTTGDGALVEFASAVDAVRCAVAVQRAMAERNAPVSDGRRIEFRIGINVGDIVFDEGDIFGDGVNIAARLEGFAEPGGICISGRVHEDVQGKLDTVFEDVGEQRLKNISRPVKVFRIRTEKGASGAVTRSTSSKRPSIAVLPFQNMSGDPQQDYFADGMVDEIITGLSRIKWLSVVSRNSSYIFKNKPVTIDDVAQKLGVRYVLEGGVRKSGKDVFALQDEITMCVVGAIEPSVRKAEIDRIKRQRPETFSAYDLLLRSAVRICGNASGGRQSN